MTTTTSTPEEQPTPGSAPLKPVSKPSRLPLLLATTAVLGGVSAFVWLSQPKPEVYNPPPAPPRTAAQVEQDIAAIQKNPDMPNSEKGRVMGFLKAELETIRAQGNGTTAAPAP